MAKPPHGVQMTEIWESSSYGWIVIICPLTINSQLSGTQTRTYPCSKSPAASPSPIYKMKMKTRSLILAHLSPTLSVSTFTATVSFPSLLVPLTLLLLSDSNAQYPLSLNQFLLVKNPIFWNPNFNMSIKYPLHASSCDSFLIIPDSQKNQSSSPL